MPKKYIFSLLIFLSFVFAGDTSLGASVHSAKDKFFIMGETFIKKVHPELYNTNSGRVYVILTSVWDHSRDYNVNPYVVLSLIWYETEFINKGGAHGEEGYMQVKPDTAIYVHNVYDEFPPRGLKHNKMLEWDVSYNIKVGIMLLAYLYEVFKDGELALQAYNTGKAKIDYLMAINGRNAKESKMEYKLKTRNSYGVMILDMARSLEGMLGE